MKRTIVLIGMTLILGASPFLFAQDAPSVAGDWALTVMGMTVDMTLMVDGTNLTGTIHGPMGDVDVTGTVDGTNVKFGATVNANGQQFQISFSGTIDKDTITGTLDFGGQGGTDFTAKRKQ